MTTITTEQALLCKDAKRFADAFADGWVPLLQRDTNRLVDVLRLLSAAPDKIAPAVPDGWQPIEFSFEGERVFFDGYDEWTFPATYKRCLPLIKGLAKALAAVPQGEQHDRIRTLAPQAIINPVKDGE